MQRGVSQLEAVRVAKEAIGEATAAEVAAHVREKFGLTIKPAIVTVLLASLREREELERSGKAALAKIEQARAEQPPEEGRKRKRKAG